MRATMQEKGKERHDAVLTYSERRKEKTRMTRSPKKKKGRERERRNRLEKRSVRNLTIMMCIGTERVMFG